MEPREISIFVSSPGDVAGERVIATRVIERIGIRYAGRIALRTCLWEHLPLAATDGFQPQIPRASEFDIVLIILWSRLGTPLPDSIRRADGSTYDSGTEFEFEDAIEAHRLNGTPHILVYRKTAEVFVSLNQGEGALLEMSRQRQKVQAFIDKWFRAPDGKNKAASSRFVEPSEFEEKLESQLRSLLDGMVSDGKRSMVMPAAAEWDLSSKGSPFRGLERFDFEHRLIYFGRTRAVNEVIDQLKRQASAGKPFLLTFGNSGVGKSSFMRAGVLPFLVEPGVIEGVGLWRWGIFEPSDSTGDFLNGFAACLLTDTALPELADVVRLEELSEMLRTSVAGVVALLRSALARRVKRDLDAQGKGSRREARLAILIDPLEEIFTHGDATDDYRSEFIGALDALVRSGVVWCIGTMRSDFFPACADYLKLVELKAGDGQYHLTPPSSADIGRMIRLPAQMAGLRFEEDPVEGSLDERLRDETVSDAGGLPLLEFTLDEIFKKSRSEGFGHLSFRAYRELGGLQGAVRTRAEETFLTVAGELGDDAEAVLGGVFGSLVRVTDDSNQPVARRYSLLEKITSEPGKRRLVEAFIEARLLMTDIDDQSRPVVTFSHETLLRHWPRLADWVDANRDFLRTRSRVSTAARRWEEENRDPAVLLPSGKPLLEARVILEGHESELAPEVAEFIRFSLAKANEQRRRAQFRMRIYVAVLTVVAMSAIAMAVLSYRNAQRATEKEAVARQETRKKEEQRSKLHGLYTRANQAENAARERGQQTQQLVDFLLGDVRDSLNPDILKDRSLISLLADRVELHVTSMKIDPVVNENERSLEHIRNIAEVFREMGRWKTVVSCCDKLADFRLRLPDFEQENPEVAARIRAMHGQALDWIGNYDRSLEEYNAALALIRGGEYERLSAYLYALRGELQRHRGDFAAADHDLLVAVENLRKTPGSELVIALGSLAELRQGMAEGDPNNETRLKEAKDFQVEANTVVVQSLTELPEKARQAERRILESIRLDGLSRLGTILFDQGDASAATAMLRDVILQRRRIQGAEHTEVAADQRRLAEMLIAQNMLLEEAAMLLEESLRITRKALGDSHVRVAKVHDVWADLELARDSPDAAADHLDLGAAVYKSAGKLKDAQSRSEKAAKIRGSSEMKR